MLTAKEAKLLYNPNLKLRDEVLKEIEQGIVQKAPFDNEFILALDEWGYEGPAFKENKYNPGKHNIELVYLVRDKLKDLGYNVELKNITPGTETQIGRTNLIIKW